MDWIEWMENLKETTSAWFPQSVQENKIVGKKFQLQRAWL